MTWRVTALVFAVVLAGCGRVSSSSLSATITALPITPSATATPIPAPDPALAADWRFNAGTGTTIKDRSPGGHNATLVNGVWIVGIRGPAAAFNGTSTYASTSFAGVLGNQARTFVAWIRTGSCTH